MVLEGGQFYLMEHHGSLCWLLLLLPFYLLLLIKSFSYQTQSIPRATACHKKLHQQFFVLTEYTENMVNIAKSLESLKDFLVLMAQDDF